MLYYLRLGFRSGVIVAGLNKTSISRITQSFGDLKQAFSQFNKHLVN
jgi:hypothetical protein